MRLRVDDEIYRVDGVWLGPPRRTLPWRARYVAYAVGLGVFVLLQIIERRLGITIQSFWTLAYSLLLTIVITRAVLSAVDHDRSIGSLLAAFGHEVSAPRFDTREHTGSWRVEKVRVRPGRLPRRVRHELAKGREVSVVAIRHARRGGLHRAHHAAVAADSRLLRLTNDRGSTDRGSTDITIPAGRR